MGEVYRATDTALERSVAVKVLADRYAQQDEPAPASVARRSRPPGSRLRRTS
jgi:hypothetical protein